MGHKSGRFLLGLLALALAISALPISAYAAPKAQSAVLEQASVTLDISGTKQMQLTAKVLPEGASQRMVWATGNKSIATVNSKGVVTAKKRGTTSVGVRPYGVKKWTKIKVTVNDSAAPTSISLPTSSITLTVGEKYEIVPSYLPADCGKETSYATKKSAIATVSSKGVVTAKRAGTTAIVVRSKRNTSVGKTITVKVTKAATPTSITLTPADKTMVVGQKLQLYADVKPDAASDAVTWKTSNKAVATISSTGEVTALRVGNVQVGAVSKSKSDVKVIRNLTITDPNSPTSIKFLSHYGGALYFVKGDSATLEYTIEPAGARTDAVFTSSNSKIVSVDEATGKITCRDTGVANITVTAKGTKLTDVVKVTVSSATKVTAVPLRTTDENANQIKENLAKIDAVMSSAFAELSELYNKGSLSSAEASARKTAIGNAFANYGIAWNTGSKVKYWNSSLSATSDFRTDRMYYGMPYIQHGANMNYTNRQFNLAKAVSQGYMKKVDGYTRVYKMTDKRLNNYYVGCDCSSFVSMAIWGTSHAASYLNTVMIAASNYYRTIPDKKALLPGDILNRSGSHVIMFLYYTDSARTQMMLIEQGGNTVTCSVANVSKYASYTAKRPLKYS